MIRINRAMLFIAMIFSLTILSYKIYAQVDDTCPASEKLFKSTFNGSILYGEYGATSQLERTVNFEKYKPANAFDNDIKTAWVEGREDDGEGEILAFFRPTPSKRFGILPGYGTEKHFKLNNRVRSIRFSVFEMPGINANQCLGVFYSKGKLLKTDVFSFEDKMAVQYFSPGKYSLSDNGYIYTIEILSVYKGIKYTDTCIAEVVAE